jgi:hypothetical protein
MGVYIQRYRADYLAERGGQYSTPAKKGDYDKKKFRFLCVFYLTSSPALLSEQCLIISSLFFTTQRH